MQPQTAASLIGPMSLAAFDDRNPFSSLQAQCAGLAVDGGLMLAIQREALVPVASRRGNPIGQHRLECLFLPSGPDGVVTNEAEAREWAKANGWKLGRPAELAAIHAHNPLIFFPGTLTKALGDVVEDREGNRLKGVHCVVLDVTYAKEKQAFGLMRLVPCQFREPPADKPGELYLLTRVAAA